MGSRKNKRKKQVKDIHSGSENGEEIEVDVKDAEDGELVDEVIEASETEGKADVEEQQPVSPEEKIRELEDKYLRLAAEFDNYKKRTAKQYLSIAENARAEILSELLTVQDNFERALEVDHESSDFADFRKGIELIFNQISDVLRKNGVEQFESIGCKFDPNLHEALMTVETEDADPDTIVQELTKGYKFNDKVLRHARVAVARESEEQNKS